MELQTLHALWLGLCQKADREEIASAQATDIFEQARNTLVQQRQEHQQVEKNRPPADA